MKKNISVEIFIVGCFALFLLLFYLDYASMTSPIVRPALSVKESFINALSPEESIKKSYSLLEGVLPLKEVQDTQTSFTSESCFQGDFHNRLEKTKNFKQMTNNYVHKDPESCSSTFQESIGKYYTVEPLN